MPEERASNYTISEPPSASPRFIEVNCKSSGKIRRFSAGTNAGFALQIINRKLGDGVVPGSYIEAVKEGEEPVSYGPSSVLADYGDGWKLHTVVDEGFEKDKDVQTTRSRFTAVMNRDDPDIKERKQPKKRTNVLYIGRILLALFIMAIFGSILTWGLENLPSLIR